MFALTKICFEYKLIVVAVVVVVPVIDMTITNPHGYEVAHVIKTNSVFTGFLQASSQRQESCGQFTPCSEETNVATKAEEKT